MTNLEGRKTQIEEPGYPKTDIPEQRDFLDRLGWTLALLGLIILIAAIVVVMGS